MKAKNNRVIKLNEIYLVNCPESKLDGKKIKVVDVLEGHLEFDYIAKVCGTKYSEIRFGKNSYFAECLELVKGSKKDDQ